MRKLLFTLVFFGTLGTAQAGDVQTSIYNFQLTMAQRGNADAAFIVARMNEEGRGTPQDLDKALEWYKQAAAKGQPDAPGKVQEIESRVKK